MLFSLENIYSISNKSCLSIFICYHLVKSHTHTHTHTHIYIYIYRKFLPLIIICDIESR